MKAIFKSRSVKPGAVDTVIDSVSGKVVAEFKGEYITSDESVIAKMIECGYPAIEVPEDVPGEAPKAETKEVPVAPETHEAKEPAKPKVRKGAKK